MATLSDENAVVISPVSGTALGPFATGFTCYEPGDVVVLVRVPFVADRLIDLTTDYTLSGSTPEANGYNVTLTQLPFDYLSWPLGSKIVIYRATEARQPYDLTPEIEIKPTSLRKALDRSMRLHQEHQRDLERALLVPEGESGYRMPPASVRRNTVAVWADTEEAELREGLNVDLPLTQSVAEDNTTQAPSAAAVFDALALKLSLSGGTMTGHLTGPATGHHFRQNGAKFLEWGDRGLFGAAVENDGAFPNVEKDYLTEAMDAIDGYVNLTSTQFAFLNNFSNAAANTMLVGVQSKYFSSASTSAIGHLTVGLNNNTTYATNLWVNYGEYYHMNNTVGSSYLNEGEGWSAVATIIPNPYQQGNAIHNQWGMGAEVPGGYDGSAIHQYVRNPNRVHVGHNVMADSLTAANDYCFMALGYGHKVQWYSSNTNKSGYLRSYVDIADHDMGIVYSNDGVQIRGDDGTPLFQVPEVPLAVNGLNVIPGTTGVEVVLTPMGTDADQFVALRGRGSGGGAALQTFTGQNAVLVARVGGNTAIGFHGATPSAKLTLTGAASTIPDATTRAIIQQMGNFFATMGLFGNGYT